MNTPNNLLNTTPTILKIRDKGYMKKVETKPLDNSAIENFLKSPFACSIFKNKELWKFNDKIKDKITAVKINKK